MAFWGLFNKFQILWSNIWGSSTESPIYISKHYFSAVVNLVHTFPLRSPFSLQKVKNHLKKFIQQNSGLPIRESSDFQAKFARMQGSGYDWNQTSEGGTKNARERCSVFKLRRMLGFAELIKSTFFSQNFWHFSLLVFFFKIPQRWHFSFLYL